MKGSVLFGLARLPSRNHDHNTLLLEVEGELLHDLMAQQLQRHAFGKK